MPRKFFCSIKEIVENGGLEKAGLVPQSVEEILSHIHRPGGFWHVIQRHKYTGEIEVEQLIENNWTDNGVSVMFDSVLHASSPSAFTPANIMVISQTLGHTTTTANISSGGTVTSITVAAPTGPNIPSGTTLVIDPGGQNFVVTLTASITGAGTFAVSSTAGPGSTINSGANVRYAYSAVPTADPSSIASPVSYTAAMTSGQFTKTLTTGYGNRQIVVTNNSTYLYNTSGSPAATAGSYTTAYMGNTSPISANNQTVLIVVFDAVLVVDSTHVGEVTVTEKL